MTTIYEVLRRPLVTEKTNYQSGKLNKYSFEVAGSATRVMVKDAVEKLFDVKVENVNIINTPAKRGRRARSRRLLVRRAGYKKAIVTLEAGQTLSIFEGVQ
ncbi:MAG: 50S ribosomal protein L23 [Anaerolineae bacterium CG_4_9_14_3_um_filter_57_17]|nr:50S ribosomal protein L23 [bacterium]NCT20892.1 50S ribosomal protein L23 [bacterium]OIO85017.1 MAG: 50S ribosomal protein L23 [Anaerolineae bacterium CG2_30_57_67]PJB68041.1 MAG: 50S ribosomal protein L23 [Anaerolineae bacterium CG_4_9_14_3_um_filter_57_17]